MPSRKPAVIEINDQLGGYSESDKLRDVYRDLRRNVLTTDPIQKSTRPFVNPPGHVSGHYGWELYEVDDSLVMLEYFGGWTGHCWQFRENSPPPSHKDSWLHHITLTVHRPRKRVLEQVDKVVSKYPERSRARASKTS